MNALYSRRRPLILTLVATCQTLLSLSSPGAALHTQVLNLQPGWNAVALEVAPADTRLAQQFGAAPVEIVAALLPGSEPAYHPRDPVEFPWQEEGWAVWYHANRPDAQVTDLHALTGIRAMLIFCSAAFRWEVSGEPILRALPWKPRAYNFRGFGVDTDHPPTFAAYFAGSAAHNGQKYFRLVDGRWSLVREPAITYMRAGEAYWIYSADASEYQGPIEVTMSSGRGLSFGKAGTLLELKVRNAGATPASLQLETVSGYVPLSYQVRDLSELETHYPDLPPALNVGELRVGESASLVLLPRREAMTGARQTALWRVSNGQGAQAWLPISAERP